LKVDTDDNDYRGKDQDYISYKKIPEYSYSSKEVDSNKENVDEKKIKLNIRNEDLEDNTNCKYIPDFEKFTRKII
jgi:hypothetical protein